MARIQRDLTPEELNQWATLRPQIKGTLNDRLILELVNLYSNLTETKPQIPCASCGSKLARMRTMIDVRVAQQTGKPRGVTRVVGATKSKPKPKPKTKEPKKYTFLEWEKVGKKSGNLTITDTGDLTDYALRKKKYSSGEFIKLVEQKCKYTTPETEENPEEN